MTGRVQKGFQADLVLLKGDPLVDINNTKNIEAVLNNGRFYDRQTLDSMLNAVKHANDNSRKINVTGRL